MRWDEWRFSAKLAWQDLFLRWTIIGSILFFAGMTTFVLWKLVPIGLRSGVLTFHYNIYLGIDDVRAWKWIFYPLGGMLAVIVVNSSVALGIYRKNTLGARALLGLVISMCALWGVGIFFLTLVNL